MQPVFYILLHEDGTIQRVAAYDDSWPDSVDAGVAEFIRVTGEAQMLQPDGNWKELE